MMFLKYMVGSMAISAVTGAFQSGFGRPGKLEAIRGVHSEHGKIKTALKAGRNWAAAYNSLLSKRYSKATVNAVAKELFSEDPTIRLLDVEMSGIDEEYLRKNILPTMLQDIIKLPPSEVKKYLDAKENTLKDFSGIPMYRKIVPDRIVNELMYSLKTDWIRSKLEGYNDPAVWQYTRKALEIVCEKRLIEKVAQEYNQCHKSFDPEGEIFGRRRAPAVATAMDPHTAFFLVQREKWLNEIKDEIVAGNYEKFRKKILDGGFDAEELENDRQAAIQKFGITEKAEPHIKEARTLRVTIEAPPTGAARGPSSSSSTGSRSSDGEIRAVEANRARKKVLRFADHDDIDFGIGCGKYSKDGAKSTKGGIRKTTVRYPIQRSESGSENRARPQTEDLPSVQHQPDQVPTKEHLKFLLKEAGMTGSGFNHWGKKLGVLKNKTDRIRNRNHLIELIQKDSEAQRKLVEAADEKNGF